MFEKLFDELSPREKEVYGLAIDGTSNRDIATKLGISKWTVKLHIGKIYEKLGVYNRIELIHLAIRLGHLVV